jgi:hypothetical protein
MLQQLMTINHTRNGSKLQAERNCLSQVKNPVQLNEWQSHAWLKQIRSLLLTKLPICLHWNNNNNKAYGRIWGSWIYAATKLAAARVVYQMYMWRAFNVQAAGLTNLQRYHQLGCSSWHPFFKAPLNPILSGKHLELQTFHTLVMNTACFAHLWASCSRLP